MLVLFTVGCDDWRGCAVQAGTSQIIDNRRTCGSSTATGARPLPTGPSSRHLRFQLHWGTQGEESGKMLDACWYRSEPRAQRRCRRAHFPMMSTAALIVQRMMECPAKKGRASFLESSPAVNVMTWSIFQEKKLISCCFLDYRSAFSPPQSPSVGELLRSLRSIKYNPFFFPQCVRLGQIGSTLDSILEVLTKRSPLSETDG